MKRLLIISMCVMSAFNINAQSVTDAILFQQEGTLDKAKQEIDLAVASEKNKTNPKAWFYRGEIYSAIARSQKPEYKELSKDPVVTAYDSYQTAIELDSAGKDQFSKKAKQNQQTLWPDFVNRGIAKYNQKDFKEAVFSYNAAIKLNPKDTTAYIYGCYAAEADGNLPAMKQFANSLYQMNHRTYAVYKYKIMVERDLDKNADAALATCNEALTKFPGNPVLIQEQTYLMIQSGKTSEAISNLEKITKDQPDDQESLVLLASLYEKNGQKDQALEIYNKILERWPNNLLANYNSAILVYNKAAELVNAGKKAEAKPLLELALKRAKTARSITTETKEQENMDVVIRAINKSLYE